MEFDELQEMSAIAVKRGIKKKRLDININLLIDSLIKGLKKMKKNPSKEEITGVVMLVLAISDTYKFDLQDALLNKIEEINRDEK